MCELPKCYSSEHPKARKPHKCCECLGVIQPGETYSRFSGIWDDPQTFKTCSDCESLRADIDRDVSSNGDQTAFGELHEAAIATYLKNAERFAAITQKRCASIPAWMVEEIEEMKAKQLPKGETK